MKRQMTTGYRKPLDNRQSVPAWLQHLQLPPEVPGEEERKGDRDSLLLATYPVLFGKLISVPVCYSIVLALKMIYPELQGWNGAVI